MYSNERSAMCSARESFIELSLANGALQFGEFTLKSGRLSPYFFNASVFFSGASLATLGKCYAEFIVNAEFCVDGLFGPAYKGIPIATAVSLALANEYGVSLPITFDRKESKQHGEGGRLIGAPLTGKILLVDDVITAGTAVRRSVELIRSNSATPVGVLIGLDRCERGTGSTSAVQQVRDELDITVVSVITLHDIINWLEKQSGYDSQLSAMCQYRDKYGVA